MAGSTLSAQHVFGSGLKDKNLEELDKHYIGINFLEWNFRLKNLNVHNQI